MGTVATQSSGYQDPLGDLLGTRLLNLVLGLLLGVLGMRICISLKFLGDARVQKMFLFEATLGNMLKYISKKNL